MVRNKNQIIHEAYVDYTKYYIRTKKENGGFQVRMHEQRRLGMLMLQTLPSDLTLSQLDVLHVETMLEKMKTGGWICNDKGKVADPYSAESYNRLLNRFKTFVKWLAKYNKLEINTYHRIHLIEKAIGGRDGVKKTEKVKAYPWEKVVALKQYFPPMVFDMLHVQYLGGMRPGEACQFKWKYVDKSDPDCWIYSPLHHKKERIGQDRRIYLGAKSQEVLEQYQRIENTYIFASQVAAWQTSAMRFSRKIPPSNSHASPDGTKDKNHAKMITAHKLGGLVQTAIERAWRDGVKAEQFSPNQLRHARATDIRKAYNLEAAAAYIQDTVQQALTYAERADALARQVAKETG